MKKSIPKDKIVTVSDEYGNNIILHNNDARMVVYLKLKSESKKRRLGIINFATRTLYVKRNSAKHLFRKDSSYGFNHKLLSETKKFDSVRLQDENSEWLIPVKFILDNGSFLHFKADGFERQIFIQLNKIYDFKRENKF